MNVESVGAASSGFRLNDLIFFFFLRGHEGWSLCRSRSDGEELTGKLVTLSAHDKDALQLSSPQG